MKEEIFKIAESLITSPNVFVVEVIIGSHNKSTRVQVILDGDNGVGIDDCSTLSRQLGEQIEEKNLFEQAYTLEVGSPGLDKPLKLKRQYNKNIGKTVKVVEKDGVTITGELLEVAEDTILVKESKKVKSKITTTEHTISFNDIKSTTVVISFN
ncbi:MAG: hypothetical protein RLZZ175_1165 [Bacteroidota bacterium]